MKKKLFAVFASTYVTALGLLFAADSDIVKGFDFTGSTSVTGAKLNQLVDNAYVGTNRGMIIFAVTNTAAAVVAEPKLARYLWLDSSFTPPVPKVWNTSGGGYWTNITANATLTAGSVTESILADNSVTTLKIVDGNVTNAKLGGNSVSAAKIQPGVITNSHIAEYTIQSTNIAGGAILSTNIGTAAVTGDKIAPGSIGLGSLTNGFLLAGTNIAAATITSSNVLGAGLSVTNLGIGVATSNQVFRVNAAGTAAEIAANQTLFRSTNMLITSGTALIVSGYTHNLGGSPDVCSVFLVNRANNGGHGYSSGDVIPIVGLGDQNANAMNMSITEAGGAFTLYKENANHSLPTKLTGAQLIISGVNFALDWYVKIVAVRFNQ